MLEEIPQITSTDLPEEVPQKTTELPEESVVNTVDNQVDNFENESTIQTTEENDKVDTSVEEIQEIQETFVDDLPEEVSGQRLDEEIPETHDTAHFDTGYDIEQNHESQSEPEFKEEPSKLS